MWVWYLHRRRRTATTHTRMKSRDRNAAGNAIRSTFSVEVGGVAIDEVCIAVGLVVMLLSGDMIAVFAGGVGMGVDKGVTESAEGTSVHMVTVVSGGGVVVVRMVSNGQLEPSVMKVTSAMWIQLEPLGGIN